MKNQRKFILKLTILTILLLSFNNLKAQTLKCTDIIFEENVYNIYKQRDKSILGKTIKLEFFKNDVRLTIKSDNSSEHLEIVFEKIAENKYKYMAKTNTIHILKLNKVFSFIKSVEWSVFDKKNNWKTTRYFEREY